MRLKHINDPFPVNQPITYDHLLINASNLGYMICERAWIIAKESSLSILVSEGDYWPKLKGFLKISRFIRLSPEIDSISYNMPPSSTKTNLVSTAYPFRYTRSIPIKFKYRGLIVIFYLNSVTVVMIRLFIGS